MSKFLQIFKIKDLRNKILIVVILLIAFRILAAIPIPGIELAKLKEFFASSQLLGFLNIFSGGALSKLSIAMLGVAPYITATIIMQLLTMIFPSLKEMYYEEGASGRAKFEQYSRYLTVPLAALQSFSFLNLLASQNIISKLNPLDTIRNIIVITAGTMILVWIGELISEKKIGNGISLLIFAGIISGLPQAIKTAVISYNPSVILSYISFAVVGLLIIAGVVFVNEGERKVPVSYSKRVRGIKMYGGSSSYLPLRINQAGVMPIIFAISILLFPQLLSQIISIVSSDLSIYLQNLVTKILNNQLIYGGLYFILVVIFTYFYTAVTFDPQEISKNLQRSGGFIPGIRPGEPSGNFLSRIVNRVTLFGAIFLGTIAILPILTQMLTGIQTLTIGGTALLIVVSVAIEVMRQINAQLTMREYEGI